MYIGVDPGLTGAVAFINDRGTLVEVLPVLTCKVDGKNRVDAIDTAILVAGYKEFVDSITVEKVWPFTGQGISSSFTFGKTTGLLIGAIEAATEKQVDEVAPATWQKALGFKKGVPAKEQALDYVQRNFPEANLLKSSRSKVPHDGIVDAICLGHYGYLKGTGRLPNMTKEKKK